MSGKYETNKLKESIYSGFSDLSKDEIRNLIKQEVEKGPDAMDTEYIDFCFELLKSKDEAGSENKKKSIKLKKPLLIAAAIIVVIMVPVLTVSADLFNFTIPKNLADAVDGNALVDYNLENADTSADGYALTDTDLYKELAAHGITPVTLPEYLTNGNCTITEISFDTDHTNIVTFAYIYFEYNGCSGSLDISQYSEDVENAMIEEYMDVKSGQIIRVNGMDVMVIEQKNHYCSVRYKDALTQYDFFLRDCDLDTALEFAKSIK